MLCEGTSFLCETPAGKLMMGWEALGGLGHQRWAGKKTTAKYTGLLSNCVIISFLDSL